MTIPKFASTSSCAPCWRAVRLLARKGVHQPIKHQMGSVTHVVAILKLPKILPKMLPADMDMRSANPALQLRPEAFHGVDASAQRGRIFANLVVDLHVAVARLVDILVAAKFVSVDRGARNDLAQDFALHGLLSAALNHARNQFAATLQHPKNSRRHIEDEMT